MKNIIPVLILMSFFTGLTAQDIAQWRGPNRDGIYKETGLLKKWPDAGPKLLWHFDELGDGHSSAAVTSNSIYTAGMINGTGYIFALDLNGKLLWKKEYGAEWTENWNGVRSTPLVYKDKLYLMSAFGKLVCLNTKDGSQLWTVDILKDYDGRNIQWGLTENLLIDDNKLYVTPGGVKANLIALDKNTGKLIWKSKGNGQKTGYCSPMVINLPKRKLIVTQMEGSIMGVDASNGSFLWQHEQVNQWAVHPNVPIYSNGTIYCTSGYGKGGLMLKLSDDGASVTESWRDASLDPKIGGVVLLNGRLYGSGDKTRKLYCIDWKTGKEIYNTTSLAPANIIFADGLIYAYSEAGNVGIIQPGKDAFTIVNNFKVPFGANQHWAHLVINNKRMYVRHGTSLMVYDIAAH